VQGEEALRVNCNGQGPLSAEWMLPKALWIKQKEPHVWERAAVVCEQQDYLNHLLTGELCASGCNAASRWHWDADAACDPAAAGDRFRGRPVSLLRRVGLADLLDRWPARCVAPGRPIGQLTAAAAARLGLRAGLPVAQGGADAFVGILGLGCVDPGRLCIVTGSSHLHLALCAAPPPGAAAAGAPGAWGPYRGAPLPGLAFAEGGQCSTGSVLAWARRLLSAGSAEAGGAPGALVSYAELDAEAEAVPPGADGLL
jgi:ribulose kinase